MADRNMSFPSSSLDEKIKELEHRFMLENESKDKDTIPRDFINSNSTNNTSNVRRPGNLSVPDLTRNGSVPRTRKKLNLPVSSVQTKEPDHGDIDRAMKEIMQKTGYLVINDQGYKTDIKDLEHLGELGNGTCGHVVKMLHRASQTEIAVKQMRRSGNSEENKRIIMDLEVVLKSDDCPFIVKCLGCFITESDVWICMELMATCFDKLLKRLKISIPEDILGKVTYDTVRALDYLKEKHGVIHRDVKPSNILLDEKGNVKLCDFGISGRLVDSKAQTRSAGCAAYMAPERIAPPDPNKPAYDIRADVWSLGITLIELATGVFPYSYCKSDFEVLAKVVEDIPPSLPLDRNFSEDFRNFVQRCLTKNYRDRPKYKNLLALPFIKRSEVSCVDVADWFARTVPTTDINLTGNSPIRRYSPPETTVSSVGRFQHVHHRSSSETTSVPEPLPPGRYSPFQRILSPELAAVTSREKFFEDVTKIPPRDSSRTSTSPVSWHQQQQQQQTNCDTSNHSSRSRYTQRDNIHDGLNHSSPILLQRFLQQQNQYSLYSQHRSYPSQSVDTSLTGCQSTTSTNSSTRETDSSKVDESGLGKKRFSTYLKFHISGGKEEVKRNNGLPPLHRATRQGSPGPLYSVSSQSPEPPPRLNRSVSQENGSPLLMRRSFLDHSPIRRSLEGSSSLSRRYISPSPPQPPPRRLSECNSVPGSPQNRRVEYYRTRFHYTPEPQRRVFGTGPDVQDL